MMLAVALLPPVVAGYLLSGWLGDGSAAGRPSALLRASLAVGLGLGASSCVFFGWLVAAGGAGRWFLGADLAASAGLALIGLASTRGGGAARRARGPRGAMARLLGLALAASLGVGLLHFGVTTALAPHGGWDALMIWNLRARFLYLGGDDWASAFHPALAHSHRDYPLLVPASVARCWAYLGDDSPAASALVGLAYSVGLAGLLVSAVSALRGATQGILAGLTLLAAPRVFDLARQQYADIPLAFYLLAAVAALAVGDRSATGRGRWAALAGLMAGFAAWTKNEGLLFLVALVAARLVVVVPTRGVRAWRAEAAWFALGLAPLAAILAYFKLRFAPTNDLAGGQGISETLARLADPSRHALVARAFASELAGLGGGAVAWLAVYRLLLGGPPRRPGGVGAAFPGLVATFLLGGYALVYLATPLPLAWHLTYSLDRLVIHAWPLAVFAFSLAAATPEEALAAPPRRGKSGDGSAGTPPPAGEPPRPAEHAR